MAGRGQVFVLAAIGSFGCVARLAQGQLDALALLDLPLQVAVGFRRLEVRAATRRSSSSLRLLQAVLRTLGDIGDEAFKAPSPSA